MSETVQLSRCNASNTPTTRSVDETCPLTKNQQPTIADTPTSFLSLPSELRNEVYELVLVHQECIGLCADPWAEYNLQQKFTPGLLRANKAVHNEACSLFYGQNRFVFTDSTLDELVSFLGQIGVKNSSYIRHIIIGFPKFLSLDPGGVTLEEESIDTLTTIQNGCPNLNTLKTSLYSTNGMVLMLDNLDDHKVANEALQLIDTHFRAIPSLREIILEVYEECPDGYTRNKMEAHGWTINTIEYTEGDDWGERLSDFDDVDYVYGDDSWGNDSGEYDIDDDSDYWRRAAD